MKEISVDQIISQIRLGKLIPIIGPDLLNGRPNNGKGDFLTKLLKQYSNDENLPDKFPDVKTGNDLIHAYYHGLETSEERDDFRIKFSELVEQDKASFITDSFRKLALIKNFKFFINASFVNSMELALNKYRYVKGQKACEVVNFSQINTQDIASPPPKKFTVSFNPPLIYNLFGQFNAPDGDYVLTDADCIELIYDLIQDGDKFVNLLGYLKDPEVSLLFLGCNFPDWFFRFFVRICVGQNLDSKAGPKTKAVIDSLNDIDSGRNVFISRYDIKTAICDCNQLVDQIYQKLGEEQGRPGLLDDKPNNVVFISYCHADQDAADAVTQHFEAKGIEYFLDTNDMDTGANLPASISDAIERSCLFLPIISQNLKASSGYIYREWNYAYFRAAKLPIWPVWKDFVDDGMLIPEKFGISEEMKLKFLNKDSTLGIKLNPGANGQGGPKYLLDNKNLNDILNTQYLANLNNNHS